MAINTPIVCLFKESAGTKEGWNPESVPPMSRIGCSFLVQPGSHNSGCKATLEKLKSLI